MIPIKYRVAAALLGTGVALGAAFWGGWSWQGSRCDADSLRTALAQERRDHAATSASLAAAEAARRRAEDAAAARNAARDTARTETDALRAALREARNDSTRYADCLSTDLPADIADRLHALRRQD